MEFLCKAGLQALVNIFVSLNVLQSEVDSFQSEHCCLSEVFTAALLEALVLVEDDGDKEVSGRRGLILYQDKKLTLKRLVLFFFSVVHFDVFKFSNQPKSRIISL